MRWGLPPSLPACYKSGVCSADHAGGRGDMPGGGGGGMGGGGGDMPGTRRGGGDVSFSTCLSGKRILSFFSRY